ncbi:MAG: CZB domain-containing protein [Campylobacterales bacterium]
MDHILFKSDAFKHVEQEEYKEFTTHQTCRFGKWYETDAKEQFGHSKSYADILIPHKTVHDRVLDTFEVIKNKDLVHNHERILNNFSVMEEASSKLFESMDRMLEEEAKYNDD